MKILQIANKFPYPPRDGGSIATFSLSLSLSRLGHEVTVLAMNTSKHFIEESSVPQDVKAQLRLVGVPVNTAIRPLRLLANLLFSRMPYNAERFISREFAGRMTSLLDNERFDVIQLEGLYLVPYIRDIRKHSSAKLVMRAHNIEHEIWERSANRHRGPEKLYIRHLARRISRMERSSLNLCDAMLPITARDGEMLRTMGCTLPMHVLPTGIDSSLLHPDHSRLNFPSVFHIGALDWAPNQEGLDWFFQNVWPLVLERHPHLEFYLAGRNAPVRIREAQRPNVRFLGEVSDAYEFIRSGAVMVVPLLAGSGMRIKIIEGMALGKSIVTTSIGTEGIATVSGENILVADRPEDFAGAICRLVEDRILFDRIGENAVTFVRENYDNLKITASLVEFFKTL